MALKIFDDCTCCDACPAVCPNEAIKAADPIFVIDPSRCTECVGAEDEPQCQLVCPADCITQDPANVESKDQLLAKFNALNS